MTSKWYALYTRPRWEKKVAVLLRQKNIECYCPLNKVRRQWSDRVKTVEEPLFKSYVFVKIDEAQRTPVRMTDGVVNFVYWNGKPAVIREKEITAIQQFLDAYDDVAVVKFDIKEGQRVKITAGPMMNQQGQLIQIKNKSVKVRIDSLGFVLIAQVAKSKVVAADPTKTS